VDRIEEIMSNLRGKCGMCGKCCEAIHIPMSPERIAESAKYGGDAKFVHENWTPITKEEAFAINPKIESNEEWARQNWPGKPEDPYKDMYFYTCDRLDKEKGLCTVHETRPRVCSGYPWYGVLPNETMLWYSDDCGYIVDVEDEKVRRAEQDAKIQLNLTDGMGGDTGIIVDGRSTV